MSKKILRLEDVAKRLKKSTRTIYDYVNKGLLQPAPEPTDGGLLFYENDIEELERRWGQRLSINAAARELNIPFPFLKNWIEENQLEVKEETGSKQSRYYIRKDHLDRYMESILRDYRSMRGKKRKLGLGRELALYKDNHRLFDVVSVGKLKGVLVDLDPLTVLSDDGELVRPSELSSKSEPCKDLPYSGYKGHCVFAFMNIKVKVEQEILRKLVYLFGTRNIRIFQKDDTYTALCRNGLVSNNVISLVEISPYLVSGDMWMDGDQLVVGDIEKRINIGIKYSQLSEMEQRAKQEKKSVQRWVSDKIEGILHEK